MSKVSPNEYESVDLTEDDDIRETVVESEIGLGNLQNIAKSPLPPLIPIPRVTTIPRVNTPVIISNHDNVPALTKISSKNEANNIGNVLLSDQIFATNVVLAGSGSTEKLGKVVVIKKNNKLYKIVIPHNLMPTCGPVVINVPEIGPLVIKIDPQIKNQPVEKPAKALEPFALNFDDIIENVSVGEIMEKPFLSKKAGTSTEKVFSSPEKILHCWMSLTGNNRFKHTFNGFSKRDFANSKRCLNQLKLVIMKNKWRLEEIINEQKRLKINQRNINTKLDQHSYSASNFDALLMTKKVVMLNNGVEENESNIVKNIRKPFLGKKRRLTIKNQKELNIENRYKHLIKPCYVNMLKEKYLDNMYNNNLLSIKPEMYGKNYLDERTTLYLSKLIKDERKFNSEMAFIKPLLIINEFNYSIVKFQTDFSKSNIVFSVGKNRQFPKEILTSLIFRNAVISNYIKLVDSDILCRYLKGELGPNVKNNFF